MLKPLVVLAMLTAPALADIAPMQLRVQLKTAGQTRNHVMSVADGACSRVEDRAPDHIDEIKACAHADGANVRLDVAWSSNGDKTKYTNESTVVLAKGKGFTLGKDDAKLLVMLD